MATALDKLEHIVVLMMSNRSFDHMLGGLRQLDARIDGLSGNESNLDSTGAVIKVQPIAQFQGQLNPDPDHHFPAVDLQIYGGDKGASRIPTMGGFINSYFQQRQDVEHSHKIMYYFPQGKLPVLTTLATQFAVFNRWFSSVPGPGICNRAFAHYGTSFGQAGMNLFFEQSSFTSIFERLTAVPTSRSAKVYQFDRTSGATELAQLQKRKPELFATYQDFISDCDKGTLPNYSFVEPNRHDHVTDTGMAIASDQHPDHDVQAGEAFIAEVYTHIHRSSNWPTTALLIVYDAHGGIYDHVSPPPCTTDGFVASSNETGTEKEFRFDRLGVRVPAILVSPYVPKGTVVNRVFEHASIPASVTRALIGEYEPRSPREKSADTFLDLLSLSSPRTDIPIFRIAGSDVPDRGSKPKSKAASRRNRTALPTPGSELHPASQNADQPLRAEIAGFQSDDTSGKDLLNITDEVKRLCSVLAAKDVKPPVSIGLFGEWGSGKTFFMRQMEKEFNYIKLQAQEAKGDTAYCSNIVQLWFNAWHYMEQDIWASLADEIFDGLARALAFEAAGLREKDLAEQRGMSLRVQKDLVQRELSVATEQKEKADNEVQEKQEQLDALRRQATRLAEEADTKEILRAAAQAAIEQPEVEAEVGTIQRNLNREMAGILRIPPSEAQSLISRELLEAKGIVNDLKVIWATVISSKRLWVWTFTLAGATLAVAAVPFLRPFVGWVSLKLAVLVGAVVGAIPPIFSFLPAVSKVFKLWRKAIDDTIKAARERNDARRAQLETEHNQALQNARGKKELVDQKNQELKTLDDDLDKLRPDRQVIEFLENRKNSLDYKQHLGVIAKAHADFEALSILLAQVQKQEENREKERVEHSPSRAGSDSSAGIVKALPRVDRIVLYIDDLDRCPEKKVVDVLQAIHLLLFFPLFVVVVGVDPRWMLHSLRKHLRALQDKGEGFSTAQRLGWESTPLNYLEKIFQIPYVVLPMRKNGFEQLVQSLTATFDSPKQTRETGSAIPDKRAQTPSLGHTATQPASVATGADTAQGRVTSPSPDPAKASAPVVVSVEAFDPNPKHLQLQNCEREFMALLHPLIHSPRATKRFVNVYRLLRTSVKTNELEQFVTNSKGGEYQAVQLMLAIQTGYPDQAVQITDDLLEQKPEGSWWTFVQKCAPRPTRVRRSMSPDRSKSKTDAGSGEDEAREEYWEEFLERMASLKHQVGERSCTDFLKWAPRVARYSFRSSRMLTRGGIDDGGE